jgi:hypothetical protein
LILALAVAVESESTLLGDATMNHVRTTTHVEDPSETQLFYCADQTEADGIGLPARGDEAIPDTRLCPTLSRDRPGAGRRLVLNETVRRRVR